MEQELPQARNDFSSSKEELLFQNLPHFAGKIHL